MGKKVSLSTKIDNPAELLQNMWKIFNSDPVEAPTKEDTFKGYSSQSSSIASDALQNIDNLYKMTNEEIRKLYEGFATVLGETGDRANPLGRRVPMDQFCELIIDEANRFDDSQEKGTYLDEHTYAFKMLLIGTIIKSAHDTLRYPKEEETKLKKGGEKLHPRYKKPEEIHKYLTEKLNKYKQNDDHVSTEYSSAENAPAIEQPNASIVQTRSNTEQYSEQPIVIEGSNSTQDKITDIFRENIKELRNEENKIKPSDDNSAESENESESEPGLTDSESESQISNRGRSNNIG